MSAKFVSREQERSDHKLLLYGIDPKSTIRCCAFQRPIFPRKDGSATAAMLRRYGQVEQRYVVISRPALPLKSSSRSARLHVLLGLVLAESGIFGRIASIGLAGPVNPIKKMQTHRIWTLG
jgi:hypothetical protein